MLVLRQLHQPLATLSLKPQQRQQAAEAKCSLTEVKSLPLENHSSVAPLKKRGGRRERRDGEGEENGRTGGRESIYSK